MTTTCRTFLPPLGLVRQRVLSRYRRNGRDLPWRRTSDPYRILVAEVMLQQTQVDRVLPVYAAFLERFPTLLDLARAVPAEVIRAWGPPWATTGAPCTSTPWPGW